MRISKKCGTNRKKKRVRPDGHSLAIALLLLKGPATQSYLSLKSDNNSSPCLARPRYTFQESSSWFS